MDTKEQDTKSDHKATDNQTKTPLKRYACWYHDGIGGTLMLGVMAFVHTSKFELDKLTLDHVRVWCMSTGLLPIPGEINYKIVFQWCGLKENGYLIETKSAPQSVPHVFPIVSKNGTRVTRWAQLNTILYRNERNRENALRQYIDQVRATSGDQEMLRSLVGVLDEQTMRTANAEQRAIFPLPESKYDSKWDEKEYFYDSIQGTSMLFDAPQREITGNTLDALITDHILDGENAEAHLVRLCTDMPPEILPQLVCGVPQICPTIGQLLCQKNWELLEAEVVRQQVLADMAALSKRTSALNSDKRNSFLTFLR